LNRPLDKVEREVLNSLFTCVDVRSWHMNKNPHKIMCDLLLVEVYSKFFDFFRKNVARFVSDDRYKVVFVDIIIKALPNKRIMELKRVYQLDSVVKYLPVSATDKETFQRMILVDHIPRMDNGIKTQLLRYIQKKKGKKTKN